MSRVAIVGSRGFTDLDAVRAYVATLPDDTVVISGGASGVDRAAACAAENRGLKVIEYRPQYRRFPGHVAPLKRNETIARDCDRMVAFHDGTSTGTLHALGCAKRLGKPVEVFT